MLSTAKFEPAMAHEQPNVGDVCWRNQCVSPQQIWQLRKGWFWGVRCTPQYRLIDWFDCSICVIMACVSLASLACIARHLSVARIHRACSNCQNTMQMWSSRLNASTVCGFDSCSYHKRAQVTSKGWRSSLLRNDPSFPAFLPTAPQRLQQRRGTFQLHFSPTRLGRHFCQPWILDSEG